MFVISKENCVTFTDILSVSQTIDFHVNPSFAKPVSFTDKYLTPCLSTNKYPHELNINCMSTFNNHCPSSLSFPFPSTPGW